MKYFWWCCFNFLASLQSPPEDVSENSGTPKSSILIGFSIINHPFWGTPIFGNTQSCDFNLLTGKLPTRTPSLETTGTVVAAVSSSISAS